MKNYFRYSAEISVKWLSKVYSKLGLLSLLLVLSPNVWADLLAEQSIELAILAKSFSYCRHYISPNESYPNDANPIWIKSNHGTYISVGADRGFIGAALSKSERLVLVDSDPLVVAFNRINTALILSSHDRQDYIALRLSSDFERWKLRAAALPESSVHRRILENKDFFQWWKETVRQPVNQYLQMEFQPFHAKKGFRGQFRGANYLFNDAQFSHLKKIATEGRIESHVVDLKNANSLDKLIQKLATAKVAPFLSVLDLSNTWDAVYLDHSGVADIITQVRGISKPDSIILLTRIHLTNMGRPFRWTYHGLQMQFLEQKNADKDFLKQFEQTAYFEFKNSFNDSFYRGTSPHQTYRAFFKRWCESLLKNDPNP